MAWTYVTKDDLRDYVVSALVEAIDTAALGDSQADRFTNVHANTIAEVRAAVASDSKNILDQDEMKIPRSLLSATAWIICQYMAQGLGLNLTEAQLNEVQEARNRIEAVRNGDLSVEVPDSPDPTPDVQSTSAATIASQSTRRWTQESQSGL